MGNRFRRLVPGGSFSAEQENILRQTVEGHDNVLGTQGLIPGGRALVSQGPGGLQVDLNIYQPFWAQITGQSLDPTTGRPINQYAWIELRQDTPGVFVPHPEGRQGVLAISQSDTASNPAYETSGSTNVPIGGPPVQLWLASEGDYYNFFFKQGGSLVLTRRPQIPAPVLARPPVRRTVITPTYTLPPPILTKRRTYERVRETPKPRTLVVIPPPPPTSNVFTRRSFLKQETAVKIPRRTVIVSGIAPRNGIGANASSATFTHTTTGNVVNLPTCAQDVAELSGNTFTASSGRSNVDYRMFLANIGFADGNTGINTSQQYRIYWLLNGTTQLNLRTASTYPSIFGPGGGTVDFALEYSLVAGNTLQIQIDNLDSTFSLTVTVNKFAWGLLPSPSAGVGQYP